MPSAGYDVLGTFVRHGPKPTMTRLLSPDDYEQAILKFKVTDQCDYITAQGNMDAYLRNPPDWQYQRMEDVKNGYEKQRDYVTIRTQDVILVLTWTAVVVAVVGRVMYSIANGVDFVSDVYIYCVCVSFIRLCGAFLSCGVAFTHCFFRVGIFTCCDWSFLYGSTISVHSKVVAKTGELIDRLCQCRRDEN